MRTQRITGLTYPDPKLAIKFPQLFNARLTASACESTDTWPLESECSDAVRDAVSIQPTTGVESSAAQTHVQNSSTATGAACVKASGSGSVRTKKQWGDALRIART